jgi:fatty acid desaturase
VEWPVLTVEPSTPIADAAKPAGRERPRSLAATLYDRDSILRLSQANNAKGWRDMTLRIALHAALIGIAYWALAHHHWLLAVAAAIPHFIAWSFLGWAGIGHELFHGTVFTSKRVSGFLFKLFSVLTWGNFGYFAVTHPMHHRRTLAADDPEGQPERGIRKRDLFWGLTFDVPGFIARLRVLVRNCFGTVRGPLANTLFAPGTEERRKLIAGARTVVVFQLVTAAIFIAAKLYWLVLLINLAGFVGTICNRILAVAQHYKLSTEETRNYLDNSRTIRVGPIFEFLYANMNFHVEHHIYPQIPYYNLPEVHERVQAVYGRRAHANGFWKVVRHLRDLGCFGG